MRYTFSLAENIQLPNIYVYKKMLNGVAKAYRMEAASGYVMYDTAAGSILEDPVTGEIRVVRNYAKDVRCPMNFDFSNCTWKAIREESIEMDEKAFLTQIQIP